MIFLFEERMFRSGDIKIFVFLRNIFAFEDCDLIIGIAT